MRKLLDRLFNLQPGEYARGLIMFLYAFLLLSAYLILKPVRNSLFLVKFGADQLVYMYMLIAVVATGIASLYGRVARRSSLPRLVGWTTAIIVVNLILFWWLISSQVNWLVYVFYVWVSLFGVITTSQYWLLANYVFDPREAKRLFPFIGAGAITGGLTGSKVTNLLAGILKTENLLWVCIVLMVLCFYLLLVAWKMRKVRDEEKVRRRRKEVAIAGMWPVVMKSRHLMLLTGVISLTVMVATFVDFQFNVVVQQAFTEKDKLTAFLGDFFFYLSLASLFLQLIFSTRIIRRFGVGVAVLFLPVGLLLGSAAIFIWPVLWSGVLVKISDGSFRYSINKAGLELLYLPVPTLIKDRVKALMDVVGDRFARGIGGLMLFFFNTILKWPVAKLSIVSGVLIAVWIVLSLRIRREYSRSFRAALETRTLSSEDIVVQLRDAESIDALIMTLRTDDHRQLLFALQMTEQVQDPRLAEPLAGILTSADRDIRLMALRQLIKVGGKEQLEAVRQLLRDDDPAVRSAAIHFLSIHGSEEYETQIGNLLESTDPVLRASAIRSILEHNQTESYQSFLTPQRAEDLLLQEGEQGLIARRELAGALGYVKGDHPLQTLVPTLLKDKDPLVKAGAIRSAAALKRTDLLPEILAGLESYRLRGQATEALVSFGPEIIEKLSEYFDAPETPLKIRERLPKIISLIGTEKAAKILLDRLALDDHILRYQIIKGLNRIRSRDSGIEFDREKICTFMVNEARDYFWSVIIRSAFPETQFPGDASRLLRDSLTRRLDRHLDQAFRFAGLIYSQKDMYHAFNAVRSKKQLVRARAIEFLDTVWSQQEKEVLFPILEGRGDVAAAAEKQFNLPPMEATEALLVLMRCEDFWLASCAAWVVYDRKLTEFADDLKELTAADHPVLRETAQAALDGLAA